MGSLAGCTPQGLAIGIAAKATTMALEERGFSGAVDDGVIDLAINAKLLESNEALFHQVNVTVREGRVLMTGSVPRMDHRVEAVRLAWEVKGVQEVLSELNAEDTSDLVDYGRDVWLTNKMEAILLFDSEIQSINYSIDVVNGTVFIMGIGQNSAERDRVLGHARGLPHVRRIVDYTRLKTDPDL
ncbi:MAG: BON domain-containing protein [Rhodospirillum sp.]|nr:BON domain-containing protein [Rhodospirillum sp.]MCF8487953.1 BON domain-containing protein [Rhodospirillum sp.]MCF8499300.1 BON domain-containing protein [Rhodospirillum sp.]